MPPIYPLLEVLPSYRGRGVGRKLMEKILHELRDLYMIDRVCNEDLVPFYKDMGMHPLRAMGKRNYEAQSGKK